MGVIDRPGPEPALQRFADQCAPRYRHELHRAVGLGYVQYRWTTGFAGYVWAANPLQCDSNAPIDKAW